MMRPLLYALTMATFAIAPVHAQPSYSNVYFFGTSALDTGNWLLNPTLASLPSAPTAERGYFDGRWQSGPSWSDYFAQALGHTATASLLGGNNYAYGLGWLGPLPGEVAPTPGTLRANEALYFGTQVSAALAANPLGLPSDALYVVSIGSNDVDFFMRSVDQADDVANLAVSHIQRLVNAGARSFVLQTLGGTTPFVLTYNATLLAGLGAIAGIEVTVVDTRAFNQTVVLAPGFLTSLGIADFGTCLSDLACKNAAIAKTTIGEPYLGSTHFLFDDVHRDAKINEALANYALAQLPYTVPEPASLALSAFGLAMTGLWRLRRSRRTASPIS